MATADDYGCACIILAAGASRRLGTPKQLLRLNGETLLRRTVRLAHEGGFTPVCVVLGSDAETLSLELRDSCCEWIKNQSWQEGMSTSLRVGIQHVLRANPALRHLLVLVCDQPELSSEILRQLRTASIEQPDSIIACAYAGRLGVPAIFPSAFFDMLTRIQGDSGARSVIEHARDQTIPIDFLKGAVDVDTMDDARGAGLT
jgi:molybdenum cofactor cytidylyltransferase